MPPPPRRPAHAREPKNASERMLVRLAGLPLIVPVLGILALIVAGAFIPTYGWICTALVALFLAWMLALSWPGLTRAEKLMRIAVIAFIAAIAIIQSQPR